MQDTQLGSWRQQQPNATDTRRRYRSRVYSQASSALRDAQRPSST